MKKLVLSLAIVSLSFSCEKDKDLINSSKDGKASKLEIENTYLEPDSTSFKAIGNRHNDILTDIYYSDDDSLITNFGNPESSFLDLEIVDTCLTEAEKSEIFNDEVISWSEIMNIIEDPTLLSYVENINSILSEPESFNELNLGIKSIINSVWNDEISPASIGSIIKADAMGGVQGAVEYGVYAAAGGPVSWGGLVGVVGISAAWNSFWEAM